MLITIVAVKTNENIERKTAEYNEYRFRNQLDLWNGLHKPTMNNMLHKNVRIGFVNTLVR